MSGLVDFLIDNPIDDLTEEIVIAGRLGNFKFKIRGMTSPEFNDYSKMATKIGKHKKVEFDSKKFNESVILNHTLEPNFRDAESIKKAGCISPEQFLYKSLLAGEITELAQQISILSGFDRDMEEVVDDAKNS